MKERIIRTIDAVTFGAFSSYFREAAALVGTDQADEGKFRRFSRSDRDMAPMTFDKIQKSAFYQWQRYPLARRIIQILTDFATTDLKVTLAIMKRNEDEEDELMEDRNDAQNIWNDFFEDPVNNLENDLDVIVQDLFLNGELLLPSAVNPTNGSVRLGYIDPQYLREVKKDPMNARQVDKLIIQIPDSTEKKTFQVIRHDLDPNSDTEGRMIGEIIYWRLNYVIGQSRGHSELVEILDWVDALEQFLFDALEGFRFRNAFVWTVQMTGKSDKELEKIQFSPPRTGIVIATNEKSEWNVLAPDLKANDSAAAVKLVKNFILAGKGFPDHWFADGGDTNRATAEVMTTPTMTMLKKKQKAVMNLFKFIAQFITDQAVIHGKLKLAEGEYVDVRVSAFDFERMDAAVLASAFAQTVTGLVTATQNSWISDDTAQMVVQGLIRRLGVEPPDESVDEIEDNRRERDANDPYKQLPPPRLIDGKEDQDAIEKQIPKELQDQIKRIEQSLSQFAEGARIEIHQAPVTVHPANVNVNLPKTKRQIKVERDAKGKIQRIVQGDVVDTDFKVKRDGDGKILSVDATDPEQNVTE